MDILEIVAESWGWAGINPVEIVLENEFGNLIIRDMDGKYWRLCPEDLYCKIVANDRVELDSLLSNQEFLHDWYMKSLVAIAMETYGPLSPGRKYTFVTPGVLGGAYAIDNIKTVPQSEQVGLSGEIGEKIKDLPDGAKIKLTVLK